MKTFKNSDGFSVVHTLLILVIIGIIGFTGWYVWNASKEANKNLEVKNRTSTVNKTNVAKSEPSKTSAKDTPLEPEIPQGYTKYSNEAYGFSFAYPSAVGEIKDTNIQGNEKILVYAKSADTRDTFAQYTQSPLYVQVNRTEDYTTGAAKYGPTLEFDAGKWIVSAKEGGDVNNGGKAIGSEYKAPQAAVINGIKVYDFSYQDEGCYRTHWVFKTDKAFTSIMLPSVCADAIDTIPQDRLDSYKKVTSQVLKTLFIK